MAGKIVVFGSFVVDLMSRSSHLPSPGETVKGSLFKMGAGGKGFNQGVASHKSGGDTVMITRLGKDAFAQVALDAMKELGMDDSNVIVTEDTSTGAALILVDEKTSQNEIVVIPGACGAFTEADVEGCRSVLEEADYLLVQLEVNPEATYQAVEIAYKAGAQVVLNPAPACPVEDDLLKMVTIVTPNEVEAEILTGINCDTEEGLAGAAAWFHAKGVRYAVITLGHRGVYISGDGKHMLIPAFRVDAVDTTGAGDAFNGGFLTALAEGKSVDEASEFGCAVAALSVQRMGTTPAMPTRQEVEEFLRDHAE
ncbi:MAG: ribokinase [Oscillospiraceae bacterium]|nr:ribokinase [Oscillospiraceae bacterium]